MVSLATLQQYSHQTKCYAAIYRTFNGLKVKYWCGILVLVMALFSKAFGQMPILELANNQLDIRPQKYTSGIAIGDYDGDGYEDWLVTSRRGDHQLWRNRKGQYFEPILEKTGLVLGTDIRTALWIDIQNDGYPELYLGYAGSPDELWLNNGDGTFTNMTTSARIKGDDQTFSVNAADVNNDGWLDIYVSNFLGENKLYMNNQNGTFTNHVYLYNAGDAGHSMGALFVDFDHNQTPDLYLVHDGYEPNIFLKNIDYQYFDTISWQSGTAIAALGMGVDAADINRDGFLDLYITNLYENTLLLNNGNGTFNDISAMAGIQDFGMGWGVNFVDVDNDGWVDIFVCNDSYFSPYPNVLYLNNGDLTFTKSVDQTMTLQAGSYACVCADVDMDGFPELGISNQGQLDSFQFIKNWGNTNQWIGFKLVGRQSNHMGVGAQIKLWDQSGNLYIDEIMAGSGFASQHTSLVRFGLGSNGAVDHGLIQWPSGVLQRFQGLPTNQYFSVIEGGDISLFNDQEMVTSTAEKLAISAAWVYPNPAHSHLNIVLSERSDGLVNHIKLWNQQGQLLRSIDSNPKGAQITVRTSRLPRGLYWLSISNEMGHEIFRIILEEED